MPRGPVKVPDFNPFRGPRAAQPDSAFLAGCDLPPAPEARRLALKLRRIFAAFLEMPPEYLHHDAPITWYPQLRGLQFILEALDAEPRDADPPHVIGHVTALLVETDEDDGIDLGEFLMELEDEVQPTSRGAARADRLDTVGRVISRMYQLGFQ